MTMGSLHVKFTFCCLFVLISTGVSSKLPNIVILLADDLGIGDVGCFGNDTLKTPNIDSIAKRGAKLNHHLTAAAVCTPSRAALLTGRYPVRSGMESSNINKVFLFIAASGGLPGNETTVAKALKSKNYSTALIGKWHLGQNCRSQGDLCHHPLNHGFDFFYGLPLSNFKDLGEDSVITSYSPNVFLYLEILVTCGICLSAQLLPKNKKLTFVVALLTVVTPGLLCFFFINLKTINGILMRNDDVVEQPLKLPGLTQRFVQEAKEFLEIQAKSDNPFFLFLSFVHVHTALFTAAAFVNQSQHGRYGDNVLELDWAIGEVLKTLDSLQLSNNTLVYFSSDNGAHVEEVGLDGQREGGHNGIYKGGKMIGGLEGGIRVPTAMMWPNHIRRGLEINVATSQMDIFPTILDFAEIPLPQDRIIDGKSLKPLMTEVTSASPHSILFHYCGTQIHAATYIPSDGNAVWKIHWITPKFLENTTRCEYVCHCFGRFVIHHDPPILYNLAVDPSESQPIDMLSSPKFLKVISVVNNMRKNHEKSVTRVPDQFSFLNSIWLPWLQPCCNFPHCQCSDSKFDT